MLQPRTFLPSKCLTNTIQSLSMGWWEGLGSSVTGILLSLQGSEGVEQVLQILKDEFKLAMTLSGNPHRCPVFCLHDFDLVLSAGCAQLSDIKPEMVVHESYYKCPRVIFDN